MTTLRVIRGLLTQKEIEMEAASGAFLAPERAAVKIEKAGPMSPIVVTPHCAGGSRFTIQRWARLISVCMVVAALLVAFAVPSASAHALTPQNTPITANASVPATGSCEWYNVAEHSFTQTLYTSGYNYNLTFYVTIYSEFNWATHGYCGLVYDTVCVYVPSNYTIGIIQIRNYWYKSSNNSSFSYVGGNVVSPYTSPNGTYCNNGTVTSVPGNYWWGVVSYAVDPWGDMTPETWSQTPYTVGTFV